ncbi:MAG: fibrillarin-like rRNA/tRNA 2'-O-methyltransferase [Methanolinea sp.]|nr:fibrillarin-like rRNA/tRNA 2'-O-methyltransferase [Methanolinea sp.]
MIWIEGVLVSRGEGGVYGERMLSGHRVWDPYRSKLSAYYYRGGERDLLPGSKVLYLGAAHGTTVSHVSDYVEVVYAVENAYTPMRDLLAVAARRKNIIPLFADATDPACYAPLVEQVDLLFQDVAHPDQARIARRHVPFLARGGTALVVIKARSVDARKDPADVVAGACGELEGSGLRVDRVLWLEPYHRDHAVLECLRDDTPPQGSAQKGR